MVAMSWRRSCMGRAGVWAVIVGLGAITVACKSSGIPEPVVTWRFQCPDPVVSIGGFDDNNTPVDTVTSIPLSDSITNIPEYHDCQRFIEGGEYGAVYAVFAAFRLDTVTKASNRALPVATIYTPDGAYGALGIEPGFNCLVLTQDGEEWKASMIPLGQGKANSDCTIDLSGHRSTQLKATRQSIPAEFNFGPEDFPPVARWDWDSVHSRQYVGIRCGGAWCEVGEDGFVPSFGYTGALLPFDPVIGASVSATSRARVQRIKGWYDYQRLATTYNGQQVPDTVHGYLIPNPALEQINWPLGDTPDHTESLKSYSDTWVHVGYALVDRNYDKWNFTAGPNGSYGANKIFMCYGTAATGSCGIPEDAVAENTLSIPLGSCPSDPTDETKHWFSRTVSAAGSTTYGCVVRMDHYDQLADWRKNHPYETYGIPGAARWKFLANDDGTWFSCPSGCCTKH
jgi:hypothetical protein